MVLLFPQRFFALRVDGIVPVKLHAFAVFQLQDLRDRAVEKIAVMGDDENSALVVGQISLQPADTVHVEMVGGLVEHDQVGLLDKKFTERHTRALSAGECRYLLIVLSLIKPKSLQNAGHFSLVGVSVFPLEFVQKISVDRDRLSERFALKVLHLLLVFAQLLLHIDQILLHGQDFFVYRPVGGEVLILGQVADAAVSLEGNSPLISGFLAHDDLEESGLSGAVNSNQSGLVSLFKMKGDVAQDYIFRIFFTYMMACKDHGWIIFLLCT